MTNEVKALYYYFLGRTQKLSVEARMFMYHVLSRRTHNMYISLFDLPERIERYLRIKGGCVKK